MQDYMKALHEKFGRRPNTWAAEINELHRHLIGELNKEQRRVLLQRIDLEDTRCTETALLSFADGLHLACGLAHELGLEEPYNFVKDMEQRAIEEIQKEV